MLTPIEKPIAAVLALFYSWIPNYGVAIILLSVVWMILMAPLTVKQTRSMLAMQKLQPEIKKLQDKHKNDRMALTEATQALYKENQVSPLGGCLPMMLPFPLLIALFQVVDGLSKVTNGKATPKFLAHNTRMYKDIVHAHGALNAFGMDLAKSAVSGHASFLAALPFFVLILIMMGSQYYQQSQMMSKNPAAAQNPQMKMMKYLPLIFGVIYIRFPAGVVLYYTISNVCRIAQLSVMYRYDPKVKQLVSQEVVQVEAKTRDIEEHERSTPAARPKLRDMLSNAAKQAQEQAEANRQAKAGGVAKGSARTPPGKNRSLPAGGSSNRGSNTSRSGTARSGTARSGTAKPGNSTKNTGSRAGGKPNAAKRPASTKGTQQRSPAASSRNGSSAKPSRPQKAPVDPAKQPKAAPAAQQSAGGSTNNGTSATNGKDNGAAATVPAAPRPQSGARTGAGRTGAGSSSKNNRKRRGR